MTYGLGLLSFTARYIGVVRSAATPDASICERMAAEHPALAVWYFQSREGVLWVAQAGQHIRPLADWFRTAHKSLTCSSVLATAIDNGHKIPDVDCDAFDIRRDSARPDILESLLRTHFALYLPHSDSFLFFRETTRPEIELPVDAGEWKGNLTLPWCPLENESADTIGGKDRTVPLQYDPIDSQLKEVIDSIGITTCQAAADLATEWKEVLKEDPPHDIRQFESEIAQTIANIAKLINTGDRSEVLEVVDDYAKALRARHRAAFELRTKIRDFEAFPSPPILTYERAATPLVLRAMRRYAREVAARLNLEEYEFLPVVGHDFEVRPRLFSVPHRTYKAILPTVLIEFPAEIRLRMGAVPVIAREIARMKSHALDTIAAQFCDEQSNGSDLAWLFPETDYRQRIRRDQDLGQRFDPVYQMGKELAADLLAVAAVGPQYIFAIARFAVGTLGDFSSADRQSNQSNQLSFRARLSACLGMLAALGDYPPFVSPYLPEGRGTLSSEIVNLVKRGASTCFDYDPDELTRIFRLLRRGSIVDKACPTSILAALWNAVALRSGYMHEVAALMSLAGID